MFTLKLSFGTRYVPVVAMMLWIGSFSGAFATPVTFSASGTGTSSQAIAASVTFEFESHDFGGGPTNAVKITLTNTAAQTLVRGNLLTGVFFSLPASVGNLGTSSSGFDGVAQVVVLSNGSIVNGIDLGPAVAGSSSEGTYQLSNGPFGNSNQGTSFAAFRYGISTVAGGLFGFSGTAMNGDNYGIFATGSNVSGGGLAAARPLIDGSAIFWVARPANWTSEDQVSAVRFTYGSLPDNFLDAPPPAGVPEPSTFVTIGMGLTVWGLLRRRPFAG